MTNWKLTINTGQYLALYENDEETDLRRIANLVADELEKAEVPYGAMGERQELVEDFRLVTDDVEEMDDVLTRMYDWGDYWRIWFSPVLEAKVQSASHDNDYDWRADHNVYPFDTVVVWPGNAGGGGTGPISDDAMLVLHDIAEGESTGDPDEYREWDSMISQERRIIQDELEPHYVTFITIPVNDGKRAMSFWIVTPAGLDLLRDDAPRGTTALDALLNHPDLAYARTRIAAWQKFAPNTIPLDAVDALAIALQAIDLLLAERPTPYQPARVWLVKADLVGTDWKGTIAAPSGLDRDALEKHFIKELTLRFGAKFLGIRTYYDANEPGYEPPPAPAQPSAPAVVGELDDLTRAEMQADAAQPEAARAKLTARNNHVLRNVKRMYNRNIYTLFSAFANKYTVEGALKWLLKTYVREESRDEVRATLTAQDGAK